MMVKEEGAGKSSVMCREGREGGKLFDMGEGQ